MRLPLFVAAIVVLSASAVSTSYADSYVVTGSGIFDSSTPVTAYSTPGGTFSYSFDISSNPAVTDYITGIDFSPAISNFTYTLNGAPSSPSGSVTFYSAANDGLFNICFGDVCSGNPTDVFVMAGPQVYSGPESAPTILPDSYTASEADFDGFVLASGSGVTVSTAANTPTAVTPEPSSFLLLGTGLLGVAGVVRKRFA